MEKLLCLWDYLKQSEKSIVIYGMGDGCDKILSVCKEKGITVSGIFASDEYVRNKPVHGFPVTSFAKAKEQFGDMIVLLAFGVFRDDLMEKILSMAEEVELYAPDGSHPNSTGSYLAALCHYAVSYGEDPTLVSYDHGEGEETARILKEAAKAVSL